MNAKEYRDKSVQDLEMIHGDLRKELFQLRNERLLSGKLEKPHRLRSVRREIARALTLIGEKQRGQK
ncbi:MAG: 50S ribosomal protein L29 [Verrucomicrobia bacterium]|nr:50S ribosomal protein L29 [Verrucomicrobiota bacterium]